MFRNLLAIPIALLLLVNGYGQEKWSLEKCINEAWQNSLQIKQAQIDISSAELSLKQSQLSRLPNLNANINGGYNFGLNINPTTNTLQNQRTGFNSISLSSGMIVYNGNRLNNTIKRSKVDIEAAKLNVEAASDNVALSVANAYLNILLAEEQLENARKRLELSEEQLRQTDRLIEAGSLPYNDRLDILAQMALDQQSITEAQNLVTTSYLNLKQLMLLEPGTDIVIEKPVLPEIQLATPEDFLLEKTFNAALSNLALIRANDMRLRSFELSEEITQSNLLPTVRLFGNLDSRFASTVKDFQAEPDLSNARTFLGDPSPVVINGEESEIAFFQTTGIAFPDRGYFDQLNDNFGQSFGMTVNIPIFNNYQNRVSVEQARLNTLNQQVVNQQQRQTLKADIQLAIANARAAKENLAAAQQSLEAAQVAFDNSTKRYELGAINTLEFTTARNRLDQAQVDLTRAKYQYVFNLKVVEFYEGKPLRLE